MSSMLLANCRAVVTMDDEASELTDASIVIDDGWITYIGSDPPSRQHDQIIDGSRFLAIPGLINAHHHLYQTLTRGFPQSEGVPLFAWLQRLYPIWAHLDEDMIYASTRTGLAELALSGCTTCSDHLYVFPQGSENFIEAQVRAARSVGLRFHPTRGSMDLGRSEGGLPPDSVIQPIDTILAASELAIDRYHDPLPGSMLQIGLAPCSPFSVSRELMRATAELARRKNVRLHTHIAETRDEDAYSRQHFGCSPIELLHSLAWLGNDIWLAHCVHPDEHDIALIAGQGGAVAHCPTSNMLLGSGIAPVASFLARGIPVGLGVDGSASNDGNDLAGEVKQALLLARVGGRPQALSVRAALRLATRGGAACLGRQDVGQIGTGSVADIVLFDTHDLSCAGGEEDLLAAAILGNTKPHTVLVNGKVVVDGGMLVTASAEEIARQQRMAAGRLMSAAAL